jgi:hypothetical protein
MLPDEIVPKLVMKRLQSKRKISTNITPIKELDEELEISINDS